MTVKLVAERRKTWPPQKRHRQRYFWNQDQEGRIVHVNACQSCMTWRLAIGHKVLDELAKST